MTRIIDAVHISKEFHLGSSAVSALHGVNLRVDAGEFLAIMGPSGSGKTSLLNILGCLDRQTSGTYYFEGKDTSGLTDTELSGLRSERIGFVFQTFNLLPQLNVIENVELAFQYSYFDRAEYQNAVMDSITMVGLSERLHHRPAELSGGEMQRVAIARAICKKPSLILADEPTGNLDSGTGAEILGVLHDLYQDGATVIVVTHDREVAGRAGRVVYLKDGRFSQ